jgi:hypothetical protein
MEKLTLCSKILYDHDILTKQKYINKLQNDINQLQENPKVFYNSWNEWEEAQNTVYKSIEDCVNQCIADNKFEYYHMAWQGLTTRQEIAIEHCLCEGLTRLTKNSKWSGKTTDQIVYGIKGFITGFMETNTWNTIRNVLSSQQVSDIIFNNIKWQLDGGFLDDIAQFKCVQCGKIDDFVEEDDRCIECHRP